MDKLSNNVYLVVDVEIARRAPARDGNWNFETNEF